MNALERAVRSLPAPVNALVKTVRHAVDPLFVAVWRRRRQDHKPLPPSRSRARAGGGTNPDSWRQTGERNARELVAAVTDVAGVQTGTVGAVLDWGCGSGRVLLPLREALTTAGRPPATSGCDVDTESIAWLQRAHPEISWAVNDFDPPLPFGASSFDLVYSLSIITHLDADAQDRWLAEVARVLRPGGTALITVQGPHAFEECSSGRVISKSAACARRISTHASLVDEGFVFEPYERPKAHDRDFIGIDGPYGMTFHHADYIRQHWGTWFEVLDVIDRGCGGWQDIVVLRGRA